MIIYGVAILAACYIIGQISGDFLGKMIGVEANVGGVGFAMLLLIFVSDWMKRKGFLDLETEKGVLFWSNMYLPVIVAMSAIQNTRVAITGGWIAIAAGILPVVICFAMIPLISKYSKNKEEF